ncbi:MAG: fibronectin type III domain-containing protein [Treponema sp.]|jgi:fibronectin type 3 domain-containing protein|nr:fibronectin type III domain-containing protein [Treponema sp.]
MYFRVYAIKGSFADGHIESEGSVKVDATPTNTPSGSAPSVPTGLTATAASSNSITISWSSVSGATDYYIYRSTVSSSSYTHVGDSPSTSFTNNGLSANTTYYYKVSAYNAYGESAQSSYVYETTRSSTSPAPLIGSLLARGIWRDGEIDGRIVWSQDYYFYATAGTSYTVSWNDAWNGDGTKSGKVEVYAYWYSDNEDIFWGDNYEELGYRYGKTFTASKTGYVMITVQPYHYYDYGTFAITYQ